ncbi:MFS transporter [Streptomyces sp. NPDC086023]|uniref:MFS transporter n=1 Tax=Streptomyces sp. NPDC086023 TaxID=3365746 RepID=UPI0037CECC6A
MTTPLAHRDLRILWLGMSASLLGDGVLLVTLVWQVYTLAPRPGAISAVAAAIAAPQVLLVLLGGVVTDRCDRRMIMLGSDCARAAILTTVAALGLAGTLRLTHLIVLMALYGSAGAFFPPAFDAAVPGLVPSGQLVAANALDQFVRPSTLQIAGAPLGGLLVAAFGTSWAFLFDALTFLVSAGCLATLGPIPPSRRRVRPSVRADFLSGLRYVRRTPWLWAAYVSAAFAYLIFLGPVEVLLPYVVQHLLHGSAVELGLVLASGGASALVTAAVVGHRGVPKRFITFTYAVWALSTLVIAGYGLATASWQLALICAASNGLETAGIITWATAKQRLVPRDLLGRVSSVDWFVSVSLAPALVRPCSPRRRRPGGAPDLRRRRAPGGRGHGGRVVRPRCANGRGHPPGGQRLPMTSCGTSASERRVPLRSSMPVCP